MNRQLLFRIDIYLAAAYNLASSSIEEALMTERVSSTNRGGVRSISLEEIDWDYERKGRVLGTDNIRKRTYFGQDTIGPLGIALALHRRLWVENRAITADVFGEALSRLVAQDPPLTNLDRSHLAAWVQASRFVALPEPEHKELVIQALQNLARESGLDDSAVAALAGKWKRPGDLLDRLRGDQEGSWGPDFHPIEPLFFSEPEAPETPIGNSTLSMHLGDVFVGDVGKKAIVALVGPRYSGKRRIISHLVQNKAKDGLIEVASGERLRLFVRDAERNPIEQIVRDVAIFLRIEIPSAQSPPHVTDSLLKSIAEKACRRENASAYILAEAPAAEDPLGQLLANEQLQRLIEAISPGGDSGNRLLLTGTRIDLAVDRHDVVPISVPLPTVPEIARAYDLPAEENEAGSKKEVDGPFSALLSTLLDKDWTTRNDEQIEEARRVALEALRSVAAKPSDDRLAASHPITERNDLVLLAKTICHHLEQTELALTILKFVALSEDGVRLSSLKRLLKTERSVTGDDANNEATIAKGLEVLSRHLRFVYRQVDNCGPWTKDDPPASEIEYEPKLELLPPFRRIFERVFLLRGENHKSSKDEFRRYNWAIAEVAREQARWQRLYGHSYYGTMPFDLIRSAQALQRAQIAIDPDTLDRSKGVTTARKGAATDRSVFSGKTDPHQGLRFLFFDVFRGDIDLQNRLSLQYQRDDLRLDLLMGFCNLGRPFYFDNLSTSADLFPSWEKLRNVISNDDRINLLVSIAIAAKRAGVWQIVAAALEKADKMLSDDEASPTAVERIYRSEIDMAILRCGAQDEKHEKLADVEGLIRRRINQYAGKADDKKSRWEARVKLQSRLGEVLMLRGDLDAALKAFEEAERIEQKGLKRDETLLAWHRSPLLGYGAHRYLRLLCEMARRSTVQCERDELLARAQDLQNMNLTRISRFGWEAPMSVLDQSWIFILQGKLREARALLLQLPEPAWAASPSVSGRAEVDAYYSFLALDLIEQEGSAKGDDCGRLPRHVRNALGRLLRLARKADLPLYRAFGELMGARLLSLHGSEAIAAKTNTLDGQSKEELVRSAKSIIAKTDYGLLAGRVPPCHQNKS
jgi:hypothetical protein